MLELMPNYRAFRQQVKINFKRFLDGDIERLPQEDIEAIELCHRNESEFLIPIHLLWELMNCFDKQGLLKALDEDEGEFLKHFALLEPRIQNKLIDYFQNGVPSVMQKVAA